MGGPGYDTRGGGVGSAFFSRDTPIRGRGQARSAPRCLGTADV